MLSERIEKLQKLSMERGERSQSSHFAKDHHFSAINMYAELEHWEITARSMAYAIENQDVWAYKEDGIGGRIYYSREEPIEQYCEQLDCVTGAENKIKELYPEIAELRANQLVAGNSRGHITWFFDRLLRYGTQGFKEIYQKALENAADKEAQEFYKGVIILIDALQSFNDKHIEAYEKLGNMELAERMRKVPRYPAQTFEEAVQAFFMQHIVVMRENPYGGNGPGRLDYYLWPYLEADLKAGRCTLERAKEIIDELFLRIDERIYKRDMWVEAIVVGGTAKDGSSAVNPLTYIMIRSVMDLHVTHPSVYVRIPVDAPKELYEICAEYMLSGNNRAQILGDASVIAALEKRGTPYEDAVEYGCGGCMEVGVQGMTSDYLFCGWQNTAKMLELMVTGGVCLKTGKKLGCFKADKGLVNYNDFEEFYSDFIREAGRLTKIFMHEQDIYSEFSEKNRPSYLISSMIDNCLERGRNMHGGGAKYHDYGGSHVALANVVDGLYAIKTAIFDKKFCTACELIEAMKADYKGYEKLQAKLKAITKYGVDNKEVDSFAGRVMGDFARMYSSYTTRFGGKGKPVVLTFVWSPKAGSILGATPDGRNAGLSVSHGVTPHSTSMTQGITAAINSCSKIPYDEFSGGASSMWDFDSAYATPELIESVIRTFIEKNCQIFQGNTTPVEELLEAKKHPENYEHLIVRVGGYSARFVNLDQSLQDEIITRMRHCG